MKYFSIPTFISIILTLYAALNYYIVKRSVQALFGLGSSKTVIVAFVIALALAFPVGRISEIYFQNTLTHALIVAGSLYLGFFFYALLVTVIADLIRLCQSIFHFFPADFLEDPYKILHVVWFTLAVCIISVICIGYWIDTNPRLNTFDLTIPKKSSTVSEKTIVAISDIHFGIILGESHLLKIKAIVKQAKPDIVLLLGDIFDEKVSSEQHNQMVRFLKDLSCPLGVFAINGNHDYFSGLHEVTQVLNEGNVTLLQDSSIRINGDLLLVGRKDLSVHRIGENRKTLNEIIDKKDRDLPTILMDHQPFHLEEAQVNNIDLQLSGHTHKGQLFPLNLLYRWIYEIPAGYGRKGETQVIVSSGAGTWGPPVRTNSFSEVLKIKIRFH